MAFSLRLFSSSAFLFVQQPDLYVGLRTTNFNLYSIIQLLVQGFKISSETLQKTKNLHLETKLGSSCNGYCPDEQSTHAVPVQPSTSGPMYSSLW